MAHTRAISHFTNDHRSTRSVSSLDSSLGVAFRMGQAVGPESSCGPLLLSNLTRLDRTRGGEAGGRGYDRRFSILALRESPAARGAFGLALRHRRATLRRQGGRRALSSLKAKEAFWLTTRLRSGFPGRGGGAHHKLEGFMYEFVANLDLARPVPQQRHGSFTCSTERTAVRIVP